MRRGRVNRLGMIGAAAVVFTVCTVLPVAYLVAVSIDRAGLMSVGMLDARQRSLLGNTALLGIGTALLSTAIGAPLGLGLGRLRLPARRLLRLALASPLVLPPYIAALAWIYAGAGMTGWSQGLPAGVLVLSLIFYPVTMLATEAAVRSIDPQLEDAALVAAPPRQVLQRITLPLISPAIFAAALVVFVLAVADYGVPGLLALPVYTTEVFTAFAALYDFRRALILTLPLLVLCLVIGAIAGRLAGDRIVTARRSVRRAATELPGWEYGAWLYALVVLALALGVPIAALTREAWTARSISAALDGSLNPIINSMRLATIGATAVIGVAIWLGYARARADPALGRRADLLFLVLFAVPSTVFGVGLIGLWNRPGPLGAAYGTEGMLLLGYLARFLPLATLMLGAVTRQVPVSHEEAAAMSGAGWFRSMRRVVLPQMILGVAATWGIVFVLAFGELGVSMLTAPPGDATLPIRIYTIIANTPSSHVACLALLQCGTVLGPFAVIGAVLALRERL
jgi:iron(III) transport system permease protein